MITKTSMVIGLLAMFLILTSCAGPSRVEMDYGTSYKLAKFNQTLNPEAERNLEPVNGLYGGAARATMERYQKGFEEKSEAPIYSINIGTSLGAGAAK